MKKSMLKKGTDKKLINTKIFFSNLLAIKIGKFLIFFSNRISIFNVYIQINALVILERINNVI